MSSWVVTSVGEFAPFSYGKGLPAPKRNGGRIPVVGSGGVSGWHDEPLTSGPVVVIGRKGTVGSVQWFSDGAFPIDTTFYVEPGATRDLKFTYYLLQTLGLEHMSSDSAVPGLNRDRAHAAQIRVPPLDEQRRIAGVLGALDDLIDTNERLAKKCDELCGSAYQREVTNRAVRHERLFDVADITLGGTPSRKIDDYWNGDIPWLNSGVANQFRVLRAEEHISEIGLQKSSAKVFSAGSTLLAITGATLGQISRTEINACGNQSLISITGQTRALNDWIFLAMRDSIGRLLSHATGAAQQHINKQNVIEFEIPVLSADALEHFGKLISPLFDAVKDLLVEAEQLRSSRDELLPLLMSGKIRVREAEEVVASMKKESA